MRAGVRRGVQRAVNHAVTRLVCEAGSWCRGFPRPRHRVASLIDGTKQAENNHVCDLTAAYRGSALSGRAATGRALSALIGPRRQHRHARCGCATVPSPEQSGGSRWVVSTEKWRWVADAGGGIGGAGAEGLAREGAAVVTAPLQNHRGADPRRRRSTDGYPYPPERSVAALSAAPAEAQRPCSGCPGSWPLR
jgi:hypothetical protein